MECGRDICVVGETPSLILSTVAPSMPAKVGAIRSIRHFGLVFGKTSATGVPAMPTRDLPGVKHHDLVFETTL